MTAIGGISYGAFLVPGLIMLSLLTQSISNASFGIFFPKFSGTIYEILSAPVSFIEIITGYVGAAASKSILLGLIMLATARLFVTFEIAHPLWMRAQRKQAYFFRWSSMIRKNATWNPERSPSRSKRDVAMAMLFAYWQLNAATPTCAWIYPTSLL